MRRVTVSAVRIVLLADTVSCSLNTRSLAVHERLADWHTLLSLGEAGTRGGREALPRGAAHEERACDVQAGIFSPCPRLACFS